MSWTSIIMSGLVTLASMLVLAWIANMDDQV